MRPTPPGKVIVGLSGGVDSAVAALRLIEAGWEVEALFMKNWEEDDAPGYCAAAEDLAAAQAVAERLGIRLRSVNFASECHAGARPAIGHALSWRSWRNTRRTGCRYSTAACDSTGSLRHHGRPVLLARLGGREPGYATG